MSHQLIPYRLEEPAAPVASTATDSLSYPNGTDSLAATEAGELTLATPDSLAQAADSLALQLVEEPTPFTPPILLRTSLDEAASTEAPRYYEAADEELFGYSSIRAEIPYTPQMSAPLTATPLFGALVLGLVIFYALLLHQHLSDALTLVGRLTRERTTSDRLTEDSTSDYARFLNLTTILGMLLTGAAVIRIAVPYLGYTPLAMWPATGAFWGCIALFITFAAILLYRHGISALVGQLTYTQPLFEQLNRLAQLFFALLTLVSTPILALWLLAPVGEGRLWLWVIIIELVIIFVLYLKETLSLFISKKISILHWFLYLCGVEILPVSFLLLLAMR